MKQDKKKIPELRFSGFSGEWEEKRLGALIDYSNGIGHEKYVASQGKYELVTLKSINSEGQLVCSEKFLNKEFETLEKGTLIMMLSEQAKGMLGMTTIIPCDSKYVLNQRVASLKVHSDVDGLFLKNAINNNQAYFEQMGAGTKVQNITRGHVEACILKIPTLEEQKKIGFFFANLESTITHQQRKLESLKKLKKCLLQKMFPKEGESVPELRFFGFSGEWEELKLRKVANFAKGKGYSKSDITPAGDPLILYGRLYTNYETIISNIDTYSDIKKPNTVFSKGGEVIVPASGETAEDISRASVIKESGVIIGGDINIIYPSSDIISSFLALTITNGQVHQEMTKQAQGKTVVHLHNADLEKINFLAPSCVEQKKIGLFFVKLDNIISLHQQKYQKLLTIKKALLSKMFV